MKTFIRARGNCEDVFKIGIDSNCVVTKYKPWNEKVQVQYAQTEGITDATKLVTAFIRTKEAEGFVESRYLQPFPFEDPSPAIEPPTHKVEDNELVLVAMRSKRAELGYVTTDERCSVNLFIRDDTSVKNITKLFPQLANQVKELPLPPQSLFVVDFITKSKVHNKSLVELYKLPKERAEAFLSSGLRTEIVLQYPYMTVGKYNNRNPVIWMSDLLEKYCAACKNNPALHCPLTFTSNAQDALSYVIEKNADGYLYLV